MTNENHNAFISSVPLPEITEGTITPPTNTDQSSTLDESVFETIKRDLISVFRKFGYALIPRQSSTILQQWDLWGPLIVVTALAILLQSDPTKLNSGAHFAEIFTLVLIGSIIVAINSQVLGGKISIFQSICILGYCLSPLLISALLNNFIFLLPQKSFLHIIRFLIVMIAFTWTMYASTHFLGRTQHPNRRMLVLYPIFLFYFLVSWLIILRVHPK